MLLWLLCFFVDFAADEEELAAGALADGAVEPGVSAAIAAAAIPTDNKAEAINLIMGSPARVDERAENTPDPEISSEMKIISRSLGGGALEPQRRVLAMGGDVPVEIPDDEEIRDQHGGCAE